MSDYWFKRRRYGLGWYPVSAAGWVSTAVCVAIIVGGVFLEPPLAPAVIAIAALVMVTIALIKGPKPHWRWGQKPTDNPEEDC